MENNMSEEIKILTINGKVYKVCSLLGKGKGGYSYLVTDDRQKYVLKQIHYEPCSYYTFSENKLETELRDYSKLMSIGIPMPKLYEYDRDNERILKEYIEGPTAAQLVEQGKMREEYIEQVREMCKLLYARNTNIDYYPTNFVLSSGKLYYVDYECNDYMEKWDFEHWGQEFWYRR